MMRIEVEDVQKYATGNDLLKFLQGHASELAENNGKDLLEFLQELPASELDEAVSVSPDQYSDGDVIWIGDSGFSLGDMEE